MNRPPPPPPIPTQQNEKKNFENLTNNLKNIDQNRGGTSLGEGE